MDSKTEIKSNPRDNFISSKISEVSNKNIPFSCILRIKEGLPDPSYDNFGKE